MEEGSNIFKFYSINLKVSVVEPILIVCIDKASFADIYGYVQRVSPKITESEVKEHLFYLINASITNYTENNKIYYINLHGIELTDIMDFQKIERVIDYSSLIVKVE